IVYGNKYSISMGPSFNTAKALVKNLTVTGSLKMNERSEVINLTYSDVIARRAENILDWLVLKYNDDARDFSSRATSNTIDFLNERLGIIEDELGAIENRFQSYRRSNTVVDVASQSQMTLSTDAKYEEQLNAIDVQIELLSIVKDYVSSMDNGLTIIPANIGITDVGLNATINQFNTLLMERNRMLASSSESNPLVIQADNQLQDLLSSIVSSVRNLEKSYKLQHSNVNQKLREAKSRLSQVPVQQQEISSFERQQKIKEPLYILLQQKKEEAMISLYAITDQCKVIDAANNTAVPTAPNRKMIYLLGFLLGFILPPGVFFLRQALKSKVEGKLDITNRTDIPILASIPNNDKGSKLMEVTGRDPFEETMRILRTNVRYLGHKVFQITSSVPGEGKSFISSNLALTLAHTGLKVLIVGIDLRKPQLAKIFDINQHHDEGLVPFLTKKTEDLSASIVHGVKGVKTLDVLPAGVIPPNPSELIESNRMQEAVDYLKSLGYDYILFDSAPYLPVADATTFNRYVDANIFMLRAGVCDLHFVEDLDEINREKKLNNIYIVLNGVDIAARSYGYHYGYGYGH
ncbi:MAG: polysaccharide biosynthesis tyrosine autokinase, partial [Bacteroidales bacterium]|nr:polysaccharide biosynthesis tyrosine autokinase [Bacteroidales bacterium]